MRFVNLITGAVGKARRALHKSSSVSSAKDATEAIRILSERLAELESRQAPDYTEFAIEVGTAGAVSELRHNFNSAVRWWPVEWKQASSGVDPVGPASLVETASSTDTTLMLASWAAGRVVVRVEPSAFVMDDGVAV